MAKAIAINTERLGRITFTEYNKRVKAAGSKAALARELNINPSTIRTWGDRLNQKRNSAKA